MGRLSSLPFVVIAASLTWNTLSRQTLTLAGWKRLPHKSGHGGFFVHLHKNVTGNTIDCQDQSGRFLMRRDCRNRPVGAVSQTRPPTSIPADTRHLMRPSIRKGGSSDLAPTQPQRLMGQPPERLPHTHESHGLELFGQGVLNMERGFRCAVRRPNFRCGL